VFTPGRNGSRRRSVVVPSAAHSQQKFSTRASCGNCSGRVRCAALGYGGRDKKCAKIRAGAASGASVCGIDDSEREREVVEAGDVSARHGVEIYKELQLVPAQVKVAFVAAWHAAACVQEVARAYR